MSSFDHTFDMMDRIFPVIFWSVFVIIIGVFIAVFVGAIKQWHENNQSPILIVPAIIVAKRTRVSSSSNHTDHMENSTSTSYYVTFEVESGDRIEFSIMGRDYGLMAEGDEGRLTFQGTRFLGFERYKSNDETGIEKG